MPTNYHLKLAQEFYARAKATANPVSKRTLTEIGDKYLIEAEKLKRRSIETRRRKRKQTAA